MLDYEVGDRVTFVDDGGDAYDAVVFGTYDDGADYLDVAYNEAGDGSFERDPGTRFDEQLAVATSVPEATEIGKAYTFVDEWQPDGWSA